MKKQILFLSMFMLAFIASINSSFGQTYKTGDPKSWVAPSCVTGDSYHPAVGESYHYIVAVSGAGYDGSGTYTWKVVTDVDLITGTDVGNTIYTVKSGAGTEDIELTWLPASSGNNYYVVLEYHQQNATNAAGTKCDINNIKVFPVKPVNIFWLDINASTTAAITDKAATNLASFNVCAPDVTRAEITKPGDLAAAEVTYEYGTTTLYAIVHSAGYTGNYQAVLTLSGLEDNQSVTVTGWTAGTASAATFGNGTYTKDITSALAGADETVEIVITNGQHESLTDQPIAISIDGSYKIGAVTVDDMSDATASCSPEPANADGMVETIKARPTITGVAPTATFATENPPLK